MPSALIQARTPDSSNSTLPTDLEAFGRARPSPPGSTEVGVLASGNGPLDGVLAGGGAPGAVGFQSLAAGVQERSRGSDDV
jgi:hypothetical protein